MSTSDPPYRFEDAQGYSVIVVQPRLNDSQWSEFENVGNELLGRLNQAKSPAFLIDLSGLSYMGSAMVTLIVRLWKAVKERNGKMIVINRHPMVFEVLKLAGLHNVWTIVESRDQGLKQLGRKTGESGDGSNALIGLGILGVVAGLVGLGFLLKIIPGFDNAKVSMACTLGGAAIGLFAGTICAAKGTGSKQKLGIAFAAISAVILIVGIINMPTGPATAAAAPKQAAASGGNAEIPTPTSFPTARSKRKKDDDAPAPVNDAAAQTPVPAGTPAAAPANAGEPEKTPAAEPAKDEPAAPAAPAGDAKDGAAKEGEAKAGEAKSSGGSKGLGAGKGLFNKKD